MKPSDAAAAIRAGMRAKLSHDQKKLLEAAHLGAEIIANVAPVDIGTLKGSVHVEETTDGPRVVVDAPHAAVMELGSRPHTPPLAPLVAWVKRNRAKFGIEGRGTSRNKLTGRFETSPEIVRIARAIQQHIAQHGTKPRYFVRNSIPKLVEALASVMAEP